jgi:hypothetical protein
MKNGAQRAPLSDSGKRPATLQCAGASTVEREPRSGADRGLDPRNDGRKRGLVVDSKFGQHFAIETDADLFSPAMKRL